ncbi:unnamed protein product [Amoebophrya sp. A120]|nr:unnamed protein product [Amoebophrya sp. A120]|eukprot:GSA120T00025437001.1
MMAGGAVQEKKAGDSRTTPGRSSTDDGSTARRDVGDHTTKSSNKARTGEDHHHLGGTNNDPELQQSADYGSATSSSAVSGEIRMPSYITSQHRSGASDTATESSKNAAEVPPPPPDELYINPGGGPSTSTATGDEAFAATAGRGGNNYYGGNTITTADVGAAASSALEDDYQPRGLVPEGETSSLNNPPHPSSSEENNDGGATSTVDIEPIPIGAGGGNASLNSSQHPPPGDLMSYFPSTSSSNITPPPGMVSPVKSPGKHIVPSFGGAGGAKKGAPLGKKGPSVDSAPSNILRMLGKTASAASTNAANSAGGGPPGSNPGGGKGGLPPGNKGGGGFFGGMGVGAQSKDEAGEDENKVEEEEDPQKVIEDLEAKDGFEKENDLVTFFKYKVAGDYTYTHSSIIGSADQRMPRTGKLNVTRQDHMTKLFCAIAFFYRQKRPLTLVEMATTRFRFYEDVDLFLPPGFVDTGEEIKALERRWIAQLLKIRGAVFGAVWRSDDVLGICQNCLKTTVHVFSSSGFSTKSQSYKVSLHFVWPHLVVTKREAKAIRGATIEFLRENTSPEQEALLRISFPDYVYNPDSEQTPWEEIYDAAPIEGASLKMPFNDKGIKPNRDTKQSAKLENRPKLPVGTFLVNLVASQVEESTMELLYGPDDKEDLKWLSDGSIRLDMENPPPVANIWIFASNKAIKHDQLLLLHNLQNDPNICDDDSDIEEYLQICSTSASSGGGAPSTRPQSGRSHYLTNDDGASTEGHQHHLERPILDVYETVKKGLLGSWVDSKGQFLEVIPFEGPDLHRLNVVANEDGTRFKVAEIEISEDVFSSPVPVYFKPIDHHGAPAHDPPSKNSAKKIDPAKTTTAGASRTSGDKVSSEDDFLKRKNTEGAMKEDHNYNSGSAAGRSSPSSTAAKQENKSTNDSSTTTSKGAAPGHGQHDKSTDDDSDDEGNTVFVWQYTAGDPFGVWHDVDADEEDGADALADSWMWRKPAVPIVEEWPSFGSEICVEVGESVEIDAKFMVLAAKVYAIGQDETTSKLLTELVWRGCVIFSAEDFDEGVVGGSVNVAMASIGSAAVGLRAVLDLQAFIPGDKVSALTVLANNPATEQAFNGVISKPYLSPLVEVLGNYKQDLLEGDHYPEMRDLAVTKVEAGQNKASKFAKEIRNAVLRGDDITACIGDFELFDAVMEGYRRAAGG